MSLREDFVPKDFYELIDRRVYSENTAEDDRIFELYKVNLQPVSGTHRWKRVSQFNISTL